MEKQLSENIREAFQQYADVCLEGGFIIDEENREQVEAVIALFEKNEGICLQGNSGSGKTFMMEVLRRITHPKSKRHFIKLDTFRIVKEYNDNYKEVGDKIMNQWDDRNILINELGTEEKGIYSSEVMQKFILFRHELWERTKRKTHFTTNLSDDEISARYGSFTHSRMTALCHFIKLGGSADSTDRRPLKNFRSFPKVIFPPSKEEIRLKKEYEELKKYDLEHPRENTFTGFGSQVKKFLDQHCPKR